MPKIYVCLCQKYFVYIYFGHLGAINLGASTEFQHLLNCHDTSIYFVKKILT